MMMPAVEPASMPVSVDYHHQVHMEDNYPSIAAYPTEVHDHSLYYHSHPHQQQQQHQHQQLIGDPSTMMDSSYSLPCDYNNSAGYCPADLHQANYPYQQQHYATAAAPSVAGAPDAQSSSGYYSSPVVDHHHQQQQQQQQHHYATHQMTDNSSSVSSLMVSTPYDCYSNSHDHLELKYQAAFVDALESNHNNTSMESSSVEGSVAVAGSNNTSATTANEMEADPLQIHSNLVQQMPTPEFQYEYETNYGNNEWTMTTAGGHYGANSYPTASLTNINSEAYPADNSLTGCPSESDMPILPNYCFAACVFTTPPASSEPAIGTHGGTKVEIGTYSPTARHFESSSYDNNNANNNYQTLNEEPLHPAL